MPVAKLSTSGSLNAMQSEEGNDSLDTFIREAIGKEPLLPFSRKGDNPVQWIQLLQALDQPDLLGWPLMTPVKVQMQKCERCSQEFCSPINYRRHILMHRRSLNVDKESHKKRDLLGAFWDKLSVEEAKEVALFNGVMLKEIPGASVVRALASSLRKPGVWTLPQVYMRAGSSLVGIIQAKPSRLPISSQELFGILDDASERTFLCAGTPESVQKYLFDGEAAKHMLELKNLVASTSFLFEQQLVKAWVADKDAEALRCQKLLVEEEEAAEKRLAELLERKKQKKHRQKEHRLKECKGDFNVAIEFDATDRPVLAEASGPPSSSDSSSNSTDGSTNIDYCLESLQFQIKKPEEDMEAQIDFSSDTIEGDSQTIGPPMSKHEHQHLATSGLQDSNSESPCHYGCNVSQKIHSSNTESTQKNSLSKKDKIGSNRECLKASLQGGISCKTEENNCEVIIGSISIPVNGSAALKQHFYPHDAQGTCGQQLARFRNTLEKLSICDTVQLDTNCTGVKLQGPVDPGETKGIAAVERGNEESEGAVVLKKAGDRIVSGERCMLSQSTRDCDNHDYVLSDGIGLEGILPFSSIAANEFLAQRWKEALSVDHVKLVLASGS